MIIVNIISHHIYTNLLCTIILKYYDIIGGESCLGYHMLFVEIILRRLPCKPSLSGQTETGRFYGVLRT